ncbi:MAG: hypothetical protein K0R50_3382, partial [Eubacterium sp.]|nr:hypothetical protein [Eubacterium sp.]
AGALISAAIILTMSITAFAAWQLLNPKQVAEHFGDQTLAKAFEEKNSIEINKTVSAGGYNITLLGITSGKGLSDFKSSAEEIHPDRTYAVVSVAKQDGSKMPRTQDEEYNKVSFFISPLIKGQKPWQVNIATMNGGYSESVIDGVMYRLVECDGIEMFADRGLYLSVSSGAFLDNKPYRIDGQTGEITPNEGFDGVNVLFDLPIDVKKADHDKADKYLKELFGDTAGVPGKEKSSSTIEVPASEPKNNADKEAETQLKKELEKGVVIPESVKEVTYNKEGLACYEYKDYSMSVDANSIFEKDQVGAADMVFVSEKDGKRTAVQFSRDAEGVITGRVILLN